MNDTNRSTSILQVFRSRTGATAIILVFLIIMLFDFVFDVINRVSIILFSNWMSHSTEALSVFILLLYFRRGRLYRYVTQYAPRL